MKTKFNTPAFFVKQTQIVEVTAYHPFVCQPGVAEDIRK